MPRPAEAAAAGQTPLPLRRPASEKSLCWDMVHGLQELNSAGPGLSGARSLLPRLWDLPISVRSVPEPARAPLPPLERASC